MNLKFFLWLALVLVAAAVSLQGQTVSTISPSELKLREALRNATVQIRTVQDELAQVQARQAEIETEKAALKTQLDAVNLKMDEWVKKSAAEKEAADKSIAGLQTQITARDTEIVRLNEALVKWKEGCQLAVNLAQVKETERAKAVTEAIFAQRKAEARETQNLALFKLGNEILTRYQKYSMGEALAAKEPFTGIARARLEELVQDYRDKLVDQKIKPGGGAPPLANVPAKP